MLPHPSQDLLLNNAIYLKSVGHEKVPFDMLGLQPLQYSFSTNDTSHSSTKNKGLKAFIPSDAQNETFRHSAKDFAKSKSEKEIKKSPIKRPPSANPETTKAPHYERQFQLKRVSDNGTPIYAEPSNRMKQQTEREIELAQLREKEKQRAKRLGEQIPCTGFNPGVTCLISAYYG